MKIITLNNQNYLLVEVPNIVLECLIFGRYLIIGTSKKDVIIKTKKIEKGDFHGFYVLPNSDCKIIGKISDILKNEDVCKGLVEFDKYSEDLIMWKDYNYQFDNEELFDIDEAKYSFLSYLKLINLDMSKEYLLIQKN